MAIGIIIAFITMLIAFFSSSKNQNLEININKEEITNQSFEYFYLQEFFLKSFDQPDSHNKM